MFVVCTAIYRSPRDRCILKGQDWSTTVTTSTAITSIYQILEHTCARNVGSSAMPMYSITLHSHMLL
jgi:hypothetical protein